MMKMYVIAITLFRSDKTSRLHAPMYQTLLCKMTKRLKCNSTLDIRLIPILVLVDDPQPLVERFGIVGSHYTS